MRNLIRFLQRYHTFLLFLFFEIISLILVTRYNNYQRVKFLNSSASLVGNIYEFNSSVFSYFKLGKINDELARENSFLRGQLQERILLGAEQQQTPDSVGESIFVFNTARVVNNSVNKQYNYLTINKGYVHGIKPDMGLINAHGVIGVVNHVSKNYSTAISVLNKRLFISAKVKQSGVFGPLAWDGDDYRKAQLKEIPIHIPVNVGDTVLTSGHSSIFPEGIMIGTITDVSMKDGENYYKIVVDLSVNFKTISYVDVIGHLKQNEIISLEKKNENEND